MRAVLKFLAIAAVLAMAASAYASPFTINSVSVTQNMGATVTWDATHLYVNWQGLSFNSDTFVDITINGGSGLTGVSGMLEYDFPCLGCLYGNGGGPYAFTVPQVVLTEGDPGFLFVKNSLNDGGVNINFLWTNSFNGADFNGEVFTFGTGSTPEPGSLALMGTGVLGVAGMLRRKIGL